MSNQEGMITMAQYKMYSHISATNLHMASPEKKKGDATDITIQYLTKQRPNTVRLNNMYPKVQKYML
jgi:hypothetical protein